MDLSGEIALVTGGASGIGAMVSRELAMRGARVAINVLTMSDEALNLTAEIGAAGQVASAFQADVSKSRSVNELFDDIELAFGAPSILVCNAAVVRPLTVIETSDDDWRHVISTNLDGPFYCSRRALASMRAKRRGRLIFLGSIAGQQGSMAGHAAYAASKAAIVGLAKTLAITEAGFGITSNVVAPGVIDTQLLRDSHAAARIEEFGRHIPLGLGQPADVAGAVAFLAGPHGRYISGATIDVNGALYVR